MAEVPTHLRRWPTTAARQALAARLGLPYDRQMQDWEWEVADPACFTNWLAVYRDDALSDDERFSLAEMLIQRVEDTLPNAGPPAEVEALPQWQAVRELLRERSRLHASSIAYWSAFGRDDSEVPFRVSVLMRRVWEAVQPALGTQRHAEPGAAPDPARIVGFP